MKAEFKKKWIHALENEYKDKKGKGYLVVDSLDGMKYCCLGVACEVSGLLPKNIVFVIGYKDPAGIFMLGGLTPLQLKEIGLSRPKQARLIEINDENETFEPVIEYIKNNL